MQTIFDPDMGSDRENEGMELNFEDVQVKRAQLLFTNVRTIKALSKVNNPTLSETGYEGRV